MLDDHQQKNYNKFYCSCHPTWPPGSLSFESHGNGCKPPICEGFILSVYIAKFGLRSKPIRTFPIIMGPLAVGMYGILWFCQLSPHVIKITSIYCRPDEKVELSSERGSSHPFVGLAFKLEVTETTYTVITDKCYDLKHTCSL